MARPRENKYEKVDGLLISQADHVYRSAIPPISPTEAIRRVVKGCWERDLASTFCLIPILDLDVNDPPHNLTWEAIRRNMLGQSQTAIVTRLLSRMERSRYTVCGETVAIYPSMFGNSISGRLALREGLDSRRGSHKGK